MASTYRLVPHGTRGCLLPPLDMSWLASLAVAVITGLLGMVASGLVASRAVDWYRVSSFEGGAGYFVVGLSLVGLIAGAVIGLVVARLMAAAGVARAIGVSSLAVVLLAGTIGGISRLLADVPPTRDGERLFLAFELRWPASDVRGPAGMTGAPRARLGAGSGESIRKWGDGALFVHDAHLADGRWVVPGAVELFTSRGRRILHVSIGDSTIAAFQVDLPGTPDDTGKAWSDWLPKPRTADGALGDAWSYRVRVVTAREPIRQETVGPFTVATSVASFYRMGASDQVAATSQFTITYHGSPIAGLDTVGAVAVVAGDRSALLARQGEAGDVGPCELLVDEDGVLARIPVGDCGPQVAGELLTADSAAWHAARDTVAVPGWLDRTSFRIPGLYRLDEGILDSRSLAFTAAPAPQEPTPINGLAPIALSPDEASYVWYAQDGDGTNPVLAVTNWEKSMTSTVPIDRARMRYNEYADLDPWWVSHHFEWTRESDGSSRLVPRAQFTPLPYRGEREVDDKGVMSSYYLKPGGRALRDAMVEAMVREFGAERMPDELNGYHQVVRIEGKLVKSAVVGAAGFVSIGMDYGSVDSELMYRLADRLDALLATGRFDALFRVDPPSEPGT